MSTTARPRASMPSWQRAALPPPNSSPFGRFALPDAAANGCCTKNAIMSTPKIPPTRWPGNSPIGSVNHLALEMYLSATRKSGPPIRPSIIALAGLTNPASGVIMIRPISIPFVP